MARNFERKEASKEGHESCKLVVADGGWGWVVLVGAVTISSCAPSIVGCFGIILPIVGEEMTASVASTAWIASLAQALNYLSSPVTAMLSFAYSFRKVAFAGGLLISLGMCLTRFVYRIEFMYITIGIMGGLGFGLSARSSLFVVNQYFDKRRGLATGAHYSGSAICRLIFPIIVQSLINEYGYRGTTLIWGALLSHICVAAALFQPPEWHKIHLPGSHCIYEHQNENCQKYDNDSRDFNKNSVNDDCANDTSSLVLNSEQSNIRNNVSTSMKDDKMGEKCSESALIPTNDRQFEKRKTASGDKTAKMFGGHRNMSAMSLANMESTLDIPPIEDEDPKEERKKKVCCFGRRSRHLAKQLDYTIFKEFQFYVVACSGICNSFATINVFLFLPSLGQDKGLNSTQAAWLLSSVGIGEIFGRFVVPWLQDLGFIRAKYTYMTGAVVSSIIVVALTFPESYPVMLALCVILGVSAGSMTGLISVLNVEAVGPKRMASSLAFSQVAQGIFSLPSGLILGAIRDATKNFDRCFYVMGAVYICAFFIWIFEIIVSRHCRSGRKNKNIQTAAI